MTILMVILMFSHPPCPVRWHSAGSRAKKLNILRDSSSFCLPGSSKRFGKEMIPHFAFTGSLPVSLFMHVCVYIYYKYTYTYIYVNTINMTRYVLYLYIHVCILHIYIIHHMCDECECGCVPRRASGGQRTTFESLFSPSILLSQASPVGSALLRIPG